MINSTLFSILNQSGIHLFFLVVDPYLAISLPKVDNFHCIYGQKPLDSQPSDFVSSTTYTNSGLLLADPQVQQFINQYSQQPNQTAILVFKPSSKVARLCQENHWHYLANPSTTTRQLENKIAFSKLCHQLSITTPPDMILPFSPDSVRQAVDSFSLPLVIQAANGWAGNSSFLVSDTLQPPAIPIGTPVKFSPYLADHHTITLNCVLIDKLFLASPPALQITGLSPLTQNPLATVGRQWPVPFTLDPSQLSAFIDPFIQHLVRLRYQGYFGLDLLYRPQTKLLFLQECNPRLTASFAIFHQLQIRHQQPSFFLLHLIKLLNLHHLLPRLSQQLITDNLAATELTAKDTSGHTIRRIRLDQPLFTSQSPTPFSLPPQFLSLHLG